MSSSFSLTGEVTQRSIHVTFRALGGDLTPSVALADVPCERLFKKYCRKKDLDYKSITFLHNGRRINKHRRTFEEHGFGDEIEIDVMEHMPGGGAI